MHLVKDNLRIWIIVLLAMTAGSVMAQGQPGNLRVVDKGSRFIKIAWRGAPQAGPYRISYFREPDGPFRNVGSTSETSFTVKKLSPKTLYTIYVDYNGGSLSVTARTDKKPSEPKIPPYVPTCPRLPAEVSVSGDQPHTHCQRVDGPGLAFLN